MGGDLYWLVQGSNGPVKGQGSSYQIAYSFYLTGASVYLELNQLGHPTPNGIGELATGGISASADPREFNIAALGDSLSKDDSATLVAIP